MIITRTEDIDLIKSILCHPEIYPLISMDGAPEPNNYAPTLKENIYLIGFIDDTPIGCMHYYRCNDVTLWCHVQVLPMHRKNHAYDFGMQSLDWAWSNTGALKICAMIPTIYENVIKFAGKCGFMIEGMNVLSYLKHGKLYDQFYMGITRPR